ncbi:MAG TPA: S8 family peptidase [Stenotrophomonas sp.]|jgi:serine protease
MIARRTVLSLILAAACAPALAASATVDLSAVGDAAFNQRFIVKYRDGSAERLQPASRQRGLDAAAERARLQMGPAVAAQRGTATLQVSTLRATAGGRHVVRASRRLDRTQAEALMRAIAADPDVEYVGVDRLMHPTAMPNDPILATHQMWHYGTGAGGARVTTAWEAGATGAGVVVAVIDTGATHHADLEANLLPGYDFISDAFMARRPTDDRVPGGWDQGDGTLAGECGTGSAASDSSWHGTHVSGTIAEVTNNGLGGAGIAYNARVVPVRALGRCGGYTSDINDAIVWASGGHVDGIPDNPNPAEVINMSLGGDHGCDSDTQAAVSGAVSRGTTVVVAAGNDNADVAGHSPASCANVVTVGATGYSGQRAGYSNYGTGVDLAAPGGAGTEGSPNGYIWSTHNTGTSTPLADRYVGMTGTSMATPHVVGIVALMQSVAPQPLAPSVIEGLLKASARPFPVKPDTGKAMGAGIVDAASAVERAKNYGQPLVGRPLTSNAVESMPPLAAGQSLLYAIEVPAGATRLQLTSYSGRGNLSIYANYEAEPLASANIGSSVRPGTNQIITINAPAAGHYYFKVGASSDASGVLLRASVL